MNKYPHLGSKFGWYPMKHNFPKSFGPVLTTRTIRHHHNRQVQLHKMNEQYRHKIVGLGYALDGFPTIGPNKTYQKIWETIYNHEPKENNYNAKMREQLLLMNQARPFSPKKHCTQTKRNTTKALSGEGPLQRHFHRLQTIGVTSTLLIAIGVTYV